jgi:hypothetical protein
MNVEGSRKSFPWPNPQILNAYRGVELEVSQNLSYGTTLAKEKEPHDRGIC